MRAATSAWAADKEEVTMRLSSIGITLGVAAAALVVGCGPAARMAVLPSATSAQSLVTAADPFAEIRKVAQQIWGEMETADFECHSQVVSSQGAGGPKYAFMNTAVDKQDATTVLYRAGTYAMTSQKPNVLLSFVTNPAARQDPAAVAAATRAIKTTIKNDWRMPVTNLFLSQQQSGPKYAFIAYAKGVPDEEGRLIDWYLPGTFATSSKNVDVFFGIGHGRNTPNTAESYYMDKTTAKK
jgi:hypothetical protein